MRYLMLIYDASAPSFCYYASHGKSARMSIDTLRKAIHFARMEGLLLNVITGSDPLPRDVREELDGIVHTLIAPWNYPHDNVNDVLVVEWSPDLAFASLPDNPQANIIMRIPREALPLLSETVRKLLWKGCRLNLQMLDTNRWTEDDFGVYAGQLEQLASFVPGSGMELNILTDRLNLQKMNSCGAGDDCITVAPDGKFYVCPGFYYDDAVPCGDLENGLALPNKYLYKIENAPICRICDAWQCRRCIWMNLRSTGEVNTPSRGQCVAAHKERHASVIVSTGTSEPLEDVPYEDPFDTLIKH